MYDFEKYYDDMDVKAEVNIDLSGVKIENPQGNPNEHVTNNVVYYITGIALSNGLDYSSATGVGINDRLEIIVNDHGTVTNHYAALMHPFSDILEANVASMWNPGKQRITSVDLDYSGDGVGITYRLLRNGAGDVVEDYPYARISVVPRYEFITGNGSDDVIGRIGAGELGPMSVNQNVISDKSGISDLSQTMRAIYMMLGLNGKRKVSRKTFGKGIAGNAGKQNAVIGYDLFRKRMSQISEWCADNNYGIDVKYYDRSMSDPLPDDIEDASEADYRKSTVMAKAKHHRYEEAVVAADRTRTTMGRKTSFDSAYGTHLPGFLGDPRVSPLVDNLVPSGDGVTALIPPLKDAVKGMFYPREEIENSFYENFEGVYTGLRDVMSIMRWYLSDRTKRKMARLGEKYNTCSSVDATLAFDLDSMLDLFQQNYTTLGAGYGGYAIGNKKEPYYVTAYPRVFQVNGKIETEAGNVPASWCVSPKPSNEMMALPNYRLGMHWVTSTSGDYQTENYLWDKNVTEKTSDEIREYLLDMYNWMLRKDGQPVLVMHRDLEITDTTFNSGYFVGSDVDMRVRQFKLLVEFVGGWMNIFRACGTKEAVWDFIKAHPLAMTDDIMSWLRRLGANGVVNWNLTGTYRVIEWSRSSNTGAGNIGYDQYVPAYSLNWMIDPESPEDIDAAVGAASVMISAYKDIRSQLVSKSFLMNPVRVVKAWLALEDVSDDIGKLEEVLDNIIWYQATVNESVFTNRSFYLDYAQWIKNSGDDDDYLHLPFSVWSLPARFMVPVAMYTKVKKKYKRWGRTRHRTVKCFDGVRWAEIRFYDLNVFGEYPQVEDTPGNTIQLNKPATIELVDGIWHLNFDESLPVDIWNAGSGEVMFDDVAGATVQVEFDDEMSAHVPDDSEPPALVGEHIVVSVKVPPEHSRNDAENKTPVTVHLKAPGLPYDEEIRKKAFVEYGPFSQDKFFEVVRHGDGGFLNIPEDQRFDGWKVFRATSRKIEDMREGVGLYDKVAFLMSILTHEFGSGRVELINTWRSAEDQAGICTGGPESDMLSWHNYGMAAKILVYQADCTTPIEDCSDDMKRLVKVARAFTEICADGRLGTPCNVVWCGRLTINPSLFDWEFLPIGVGHKDAFKFREAILAQKDPIKEYSYVDVDAAGMVMGSVPAGDVPYVLKTSASYRNSTVINGHHYVSPDRIVNYRTPEDIVLYDLVEYIDLIKLKMGANGNKLGDRGNMYEWKTLNDSACTQLIRYFALTNNIKSAKALIAGDFVEKYQVIEDAYYSSSPVEYVKHMLGDHYADAHVTIDSMNDAGYVSLENGKMYIKVHDQIPDNVPTMIDMHGQQRVDANHVKRGVWRNGIFYGLDEIEVPYIESDGPVIEGYVDGKPSFGEAMFLHQTVASELHSAFLDIRNMFERYQGAVMYDRFQDGPYATKFNQLENEFGAIAAQDLMGFDDLETMLAQYEINRLADIESNGDRNGIGDGSIYEKVVDNAQLAGMRKALRTSERIHITDKGNGLTPGEIYRAVMEGRAPGANDLMGRN